MYFPPLPPAPGQDGSEPTPTAPARSGPARWLDRHFKISERGSTLSRELRGGLVTFVTMAYIVVLNPLIIGTQADSTGVFPGGGREPDLARVAAATAPVSYTPLTLPTSHSA
mgnify:CR=1 FL=1